MLELEERARRVGKSVVLDKGTRDEAKEDREDRETKAAPSQVPMEVGSCAPSSCVGGPCVIETGSHAAAFSLRTLRLCLCTCTCRLRLRRATRG
jgi:hypothetical protein